MSTIVITGANKGLGYEAARQLVADGHDVWAAARDPARGRVAADELGARPLLLDVTDDASVESAAQAVAEATGGSLDVLSSKAALNMLTTQYAKAYPNMRINSVDPGFTATDLNDHRGTQTVGEGAEIIVRMATIGPDGPTATFSNAKVWFRGSAGPARRPSGAA